MKQKDIDWILNKFCEYPAYDWLAKPVVDDDYVASSNSKILIRIKKSLVETDYSANPQWKRPASKLMMPMDVSRVLDIDELNKILKPSQVSLSASKPYTKYAHDCVQIFGNLYSVYALAVIAKTAKLAEQKQITLGLYEKSGVKSPLLLFKIGEDIDGLVAHMPPSEDNKVLGELVSTSTEQPFEAIVNQDAMPAPKPKKEALTDQQKIDELLQLFCVSENDYRTMLRNPFEEYGYVFASDARLALAIDKTLVETDYSANTNHPNILRVFPRLNCEGSFQTKDLEALLKGSKDARCKNCPEPTEMMMIGSLAFGYWHMKRVLKVATLFKADTIRIVGSAKNPNQSDNSPLRLRITDKVDVLVAPCIPNEEIEKPVLVSNITVKAPEEVPNEVFISASQSPVKGDDPEWGRFEPRRRLASTVEDYDAMHLKYRDSVILFRGVFHYFALQESADIVASVSSQKMQHFTTESGRKIRAIFIDYSQAQELRKLVPFTENVIIVENDLSISTSVGDANVFKNKVEYFHNQRLSALEKIESMSKSEAEDVAFFFLNQKGDYAYVAFNQDADIVHDVCEIGVPQIIEDPAARYVSLNIQEYRAAKDVLAREHFSMRTYMFQDGKWEIEEEIVPQPVAQAPTPAQPAKHFFFIFNND